MYRIPGLQAELNSYLLINYLYFFINCQTSICTKFLSRNSYLIINNLFYNINHYVGNTMTNIIVYFELKGMMDP